MASKKWNPTPYMSVIQQMMQEAAARNGQNPQQPPAAATAIGDASNIGKDVVGGAKIFSKFSSPTSAATSNTSSVAGNVASIGGRYVIPALGAAYSGYQFLKDRGTLGSNVMNGAGTGASIGTMVMPGIGTAVGAGIGAAAGGIKSAINHFRVPLEELEGRQSHEDVYSMFNRMATDQEKQEAQAAVGHGWDQANTPLSLIVMRNQLIKAGVPTDQAIAQSNAWGKSLYDAEKGGQDAMSKAFMPIDSFFKTGKVNDPSTGVSTPAPTTKPTSQFTYQPPLPMSQFGSFNPQYSKGPF